MTDQDPRRLSDAPQKQTDDLEEHSSELQDAIKETRQDWERKRADENVPGAPPPEKPPEAPGEDQP